MKFPAWFCFFIFLVFLISFFDILMMKDPIGWDWNMVHLPTIKQFILGNFTSALTYPPLFQFAMLPLVYFSFPVKYLQILFAILSVGSILYFVYRFEGLKTMIITGAIILSSFSFLEYSMMLTPSAFDFILFPVVLMFFFEKKYLPASLILLFLMYSHDLGVFWLGALIIYSFFKQRDFLRYGSAVLILSIPALLLYVIPVFMTVFLSNSFVVQTMLSGGRMFSYFRAMTPTDISQVYPIWNFIQFSGITLWVVLPIALYSMYRFRSYNRKHLFYLCWILAFLPMFYFIFYRWAVLFVVPFALFEASMISRLWREKNAR